jgi:hypothetical protein
MKVERFTVTACCGRTSIIYKTDQPLVKTHVDNLVRLGFVEHAHFTKAGIIYADNMDFIVTGPFGSDRLQVKCKTAGCEKKLNDLEVILQQLG